MPPKKPRIFGAIKHVANATPLSHFETCFIPAFPHMVPHFISHKNPNDIFFFSPVRLVRRPRLRPLHVRVHLQEEVKEGAQADRTAERTRYVCMYVCMGLFR